MPPPVLLSMFYFWHRLLIPAGRTKKGSLGYTPGKPLPLNLGQSAEYHIVNVHSGWAFYIIPGMAKLYTGSHCTWGHRLGDAGVYQPFKGVDAVWRMISLHD